MHPGPNQYHWRSMFQIIKILCNFCGFVHFIATRASILLMCMLSIFRYLPGQNFNKIWNYIAMRQYYSNNQTYLLILIELECRVINNTRSWKRPGLKYWAKQFKKDIWESISKHPCLIAIWLSLSTGLNRPSIIDSEPFFFHKKKYLLNLL